MIALVCVPGAAALALQTGDGQAPDSGHALVSSIPGNVERTTPQRAISADPIGFPPQPITWGGPHTFLATQPKSGTPIAYDPVQPLRYVVNPRTAPNGGVELIADAIIEIERATGPSLAGYAGRAGSSHVESHPGGPHVYVSGLVVLEGRHLSEAMTWRGGPGLVRGTILHELGHLVGLGHVEGGTQIMSQRGGVAELAAGDRQGLAALGAGPCVPEL